MFFPKVEIEEKTEDGNEIYDNFNPQQLTILVVDDEEIVRQATTEVLRDLGHDVIQASSGMNALGILRKTPEINLVVTDHLMPGMTGANLATEIYNSYPRLPVMIITGYTNLDELPKNVPFLSKPFKQREMAKMIEYVTTKHRRS
jgi:CheY-like chemotaxis protein